MPLLMCFLLTLQQIQIMMYKKAIQEIILSQQSFIKDIKVQPRKLDIEPVGNYVLTGIRRAGKTYMLYQYIQQLLQEGHDIREILFVNFEDERITDITKEQLHLVIDAYREMFAGEPIIFLDEIQNVSGWEHFARRLADENRRVFITGSNAHMLSREIASTLGGRFLVKEIWPFTFREYLQYEGVIPNMHWELSPQKSDIVRLFKSYFYFGGLSESFGFIDKRPWLTSLYQKVLYSDIITRKNIRNERSLSLLVRKIADSVMQPTAVKRLQNILQGDGTKITRDTISTYLSYLEDAFLCFHISNFSDTVSQRESIQKHYFYDNGILNLFLLSPEPKLLENIVAINLYHLYGNDLYYYNRNVEVDFYIPSERTAIQVSYDISNADTLDREVSALVKLNTFKPLYKAVIITFNDENTIIRNGLTISVVPVWKWLLGQ